MSGVHGPRAFPGSLTRRVVGLGSLLALEWVFISATFQPFLGGTRLAWFAVPFCSVFLAFGYWRVRAFVPGLSEELRRVPVRWSLVAVHLAALATFVILASTLDGTGPRDLSRIALLYAAALLSIASAVVLFVPFRSVVALLRRAGNVWVYAAVTALLAWNLVFTLSAFWDAVPANPLQVMTFQCVQAVLRLFVAPVSADPLTMRIATPEFRVVIAGACSGAEGVGLMLVFSTAWLWFFRLEHRFPHALLLIPLALLLVWTANVGRIAALILIGHAGAKAIAVGGFHSQAGWLAFNAVALGFAAVAGRLTWFSHTPGAKPLEERPARNPTAAYLVPFLVILAAALVSRALSAGFEWLYPLRLVSAAAALWVLRSNYAALNWRFSPASIGAGALVFLIWIALDQSSGAVAGSAFQAQLSDMPLFLIPVWLACRTAAAVITVPIAEELAFRGYLARRLVSSDFEGVSFRQLTWASLAVSSIAFGIMHGGQWFAGTIAGVVYASVLVRYGRIGDAVVAHATTNALLAAWVLARGEWHLW